MGDESVDSDAPTQLGEVGDQETQSVRAWGLDNGDDVETDRFATPNRITGAAVIASLVVALVAGVIAWRHLNRPEEAPAAAMTTAQAPPPVKVPAPPPPVFDGVYNLFHDWAHTTFRGNKTEGGDTIDWEDTGEEDPDMQFTFTSSCTVKECTAVGFASDEVGRKLPGASPYVLRYEDGAWVDTAYSRFQQDCFDKSNGEVTGTSWTSVRLRFEPLSNGGMVGSTTSTVDTNECGDQGNTLVTPLIVTRIRDNPPPA